MKLYINEKNRKGHIEPEIYGHFSEHLGRCIYEGIYVGEDSPIPNKNGMRTDVVEALKKIKVPVLRWPGGCFADEYHWMDGVGPKESRKQMINTNWGGGHPTITAIAIIIIARLRKICFTPMNSAFLSVKRILL